jgi:hypothetical protein
MDRACTDHRVGEERVRTGLAVERTSPSAGSGLVWLRCRRSTEVPKAVTTVHSSPRLPCRTGSAGRSAGSRRSRTRRSGRRSVRPTRHPRRPGRSRWQSPAGRDCGSSGSRRTRSRHWGGIRQRRRGRCRWDRSWPRCIPARGRRCSRRTAPPGSPGSRSRRRRCRGTAWGPSKFTTTVRSSGVHAFTPSKKLTCAQPPSGWVQYS